MLQRLTASRTADPRTAIFFMLALLLTLPVIMRAQESSQKTYGSAEDASQALFAAAQMGDKATMLQVLGPWGDEIISSGDEVQDKNTRDIFIAKYQEMHRVAHEPDGTTTLYVGAENWPVPIPLVSKGGAWYFDSETGKQEILFRRIGRNEFAAMDICQALVDAERDYYSQSRDGKPQQYTQKFDSEEGKHDGLYWKTSADEPESPIGPLVAHASAEGYTRKQEEAPTPYHGYLYRILASQGTTAPGGAKNYVIAGQMTGGFAIVAFPAVYRSSGVMTFIVNQDGAIYQKDLGPDTAKLASTMKEYSPDKTWRKAE